MYHSQGSIMQPDMSTDIPAGRQHKRKIILESLRNLDKASCMNAYDYTTYLASVPVSSDIFDKTEDCSLPVLKTPLIEDSSQEATSPRCKLRQRLSTVH
ncbi:unnamed protein product [Notodromas monacha]|uniref:Uncharacterized protein n=1 Tax=Notodromas monacha TaxID=399045 RepID=A0A7R9BNH4_9CRUS|nr:unnamed protein product [Notodromas monacha]CAG0917385.1 unnamed protein product [Notodromas monacha]